MPAPAKKERLGDILLRKRLIASDQLDQAVQCQVIFGGRLGTNLLELGHLAEADLSAALAERCGVPTVSRSELERIAPAVVALLTPAQAARWMAVPLRLAGNELFTAMQDPQDAAALQALAVITRKTIRPRAVLEVHLRWALDLHYAIKREARFLSLERTLAALRESREAASARPVRPINPGDTFWAGSQTIPKIGAEPMLPDPQSITAIEGAPKTLDDFWERVGRTSHPHQLLPRVFQDLAEAADREQIGKIVLDFAARVLPRVALFVVREGMVFGWDARGVRLSREYIAGIMIPLDRPSAFQTAVQTGSVSLGRFPDYELNRRFLRALGVDLAAPVVLIPVSLGGRVVAVLYGDMELRREQLPEIGDLQTVLQEAKKAFTRLIRQSKSGS